MASSKKSVNEVLAEALRFFKGDRWSNSSLARASGIAESTIRNYLAPEKRGTGKTGKEPSAKLTELDKLAEVLGVSIADLVTDLTDAERMRRHRMHAAAYYAEHGRLPAWAPPDHPAVEAQPAVGHQSQPREQVSPSRAAPRKPASKAA